MMYNNINRKFPFFILNIKIYNQNGDLLFNKKVKKTLLPYKDIFQKNLISETGFISYINLKKRMEDSKIEMKDDYSQYLFYFMKQYDNPNIPTEHLKIQKSF